MKIAGLDIGTTGCKCTVFDQRGQMLDRAYRDYPVRRAAQVHEVDTSAVLDAALDCLRDMARSHPQIGAIGVTSFGETFVCGDEHGRPLYPGMLYTDPRGREECQELIRALGETTIAAITGLRPHEMYSISKIMWIKKHRPQVFAATRRIFMMADFVVYHLTGKAQIEYSLATRSMAFDIRSLRWSPQVLDAAGIDVGLLSEMVPMGTLAGGLTPQAASRIGLSQSVQVVTVCHDQVAAAVGAGAFDPGVAVDGAGTVECLTPLYDRMPDPQVMFRGYFAVVPYVIPGHYVAYAFSYTGGALIRWCVDTLAKKEKECAAAQGVSVYAYLERAYEEQEAAAAGGADGPDGGAKSPHSCRPPTGLLVLPHFAGAATPHMDLHAKGAVLGLTLATTAADLYRACMEGVAYEMYLNLQALRGSGMRFSKIHATGGGAQSATWMQMKADMLNMPMVALKTAEAGTVGCAMLTGVAMGLFADLQDAAAHMVEEAATYWPRADMHAMYLSIFERYSRAYPALRSLV